MKPCVFYLLHGAIGCPQDFTPIVRQLQQLGHHASALDLLDFLPHPDLLAELAHAPYPHPPNDTENPLIQTALTINQHLVKSSAHESSLSSPVTRILVGYSMGGRLALHAITHSSNPCHAAVLISTHPGLRTKKARHTRWQQDQNWADLAATLPWPKFLDAWHQREILAATPTPDRASLAVKQAAIAHSLNAWSLAHQDDFREKSGKHPVHRLWITGEHDTKFTSLAIEATLNHITDELHILGDAHHRIPFSHPEKLTQSLHRFSQSLPPTTTPNH